MKKVLGIIALAACMACTEKPKTFTHPEIEDTNVWSCIDNLEYEYEMLNESGDPFPSIARYAWADIDGDGVGELFLASEEGVFPEIAAAFALGGEEPQCIGFEDPSHSMYYYPEGVSTCGTGMSRYNYMDRRDRLQDSKLQWELSIEETKSVYEDEEIDFSQNIVWYPELNESHEPTPKEVEALLAEFSEQYELKPDWQPLDGLYDTKEYNACGITIEYNANRYAVTQEDVTGTDFYMLLENPKDNFEYIGFTGYYDDSLEVLQDNENAELAAELLKGTCEENSLNISDNEDFEVYDDYISVMDYYHPENGYFYKYEAGFNGKQVHGVIGVKAFAGGYVLVMHGQSLSYNTSERMVEQFANLVFDR